jgi:hypothetical protein
VTIIPQCFTCKHFHDGSGATGNLRCDAYPNQSGIPQAILLAEHDHRKPYPGDHGIRYERKPTAAD